MPFLDSSARLRAWKVSPAHPIARQISPLARALIYSDEEIAIKLTALTLNEKLLSHRPMNVININDNIKI